MVDLEVENTLREIRERVLTESTSRAVAPNPSAAGQALTMGSDGTDAACESAGVEALARMQANLSTTGRAWSRLPPLLTYRRGFAARVELWLKRQVKRAAHWFTWEQVNFNSAAHHALTDARDALAAHEQALAAQGQALAELRAALRHQQAAAESNAARFSEMHARFESALAQLASSVEQLRAEQRALDAEQRAQIQTRAAELRNESRERIEHLLEEQRVCFKQLSLEASEAAVMHDRARRQIEARIEALEMNDKKRSGV
jgi:hypothetical protein